MASRSDWSSPGCAAYSASCSPCSGSASSCTGGWAAGACRGSYTALSIFLLRDYSPLAVAGYTMLFAGLAVLPLASLDLVRADWGAVSVGAWAAAAYSALAVAAFGFSAWQWGISRIGANRVLVYQYLITLTGVVCGILLLEESLGANQLLGAAVIFCGVYLGRRQ